MKIAGIFFQNSSEDPNLRVINAEPLGLEYILAIAKEEGYKVKLFQYIEDIDEKVTNDLINYKPDILAFTLVTYQAKKGILLLKYLKYFLPNAISVAGGPHPSGIPEHLLKNGFDICVRGEGEDTFREILSNLNYKKNWKNIKGISFQIDGDIKHNKSRERIKNLDKLPKPYRELDLLRKKDIGIIYPAPSKQTGYAVIDYSRGCIFSCFFCDSPKMWGRKQIYKKPLLIINEMAELFNKYNVNTFFFSDLNFTANKNAVREFCNLFIKSDLPIYWKCESNIITANEKILRLMKKAHCSRISWGIESINLKTLNRINKYYDLDRLKKILNSAAKFGIINHALYMIGFPWETEKSILEDFRILNDLNIHQLRIAIATPFPNSLWYQNTKDLEKDFDSFEKYDTDNLIIQYNIEKKRARSLVVELLDLFYLDKKYENRISDFLSKHSYFEESFKEYFKFIKGKAI